jgi:hypothetical protein
MSEQNGVINLRGYGPALIFSVGPDGLQPLAQDGEIPTHEEIAALICDVLRWYTQHSPEDIARLNAAEAARYERSVAAIRNGRPQHPEHPGVVYLIRSGEHYKIGMSRRWSRRRQDFGLRLPHPVEVIETIETNSPRALERYWHEAFAAKRVNGEWFSLTADDVALFCRAAGGKGVRP